MRNVYYMANEPACRVEHPRDKDGRAVLEYYDREQREGAIRLRTEIYAKRERINWFGGKNYTLKEWRALNE